jgi:hypothetical protein
MLHQEVLDALKIRHMQAQKIARLLDGLILGQIATKPISCDTCVTTGMASATCFLIFEK